MISEKEVRVGNIMVRVEEREKYWAEPIIATIYVMSPKSDTKKVKRYYGEKDVIIYCEESSTDRLSDIYTVPSNSTLEWEMAKRILEEVSWVSEWKSEGYRVEIEVNDSDVFVVLIQGLEKLKK
ncbi:MAG: hypothetical protein QXT37_03480 [Thermofilaceae archaeon]